MPSPKLHDLLRDGRYALHSDLSPDNDDEFYLTGRVRPVEDAAERAVLTEAYASERPDFDVAHLKDQTLIDS